MGLWKNIKLFLKGWRRIDYKDIPKWVDNADYKWQKKLGHRPYNMTKHFVGKTFVYRVRYGCGGQGDAPLIGWHKRKRNKNKGKSYYQIGLDNIPREVLKGWKRSSKSKIEFRKWVESSGYKFVHGG